jgi:YebC/PmpR family DNA-binding regulatory protein
MSGHSKWSTIKRAKGITDAKRGQAFTKLANAITIATKLGNSGDIDSNPRLRLAVETARGLNMPKENVQRAIDRGLGKLGGQSLEEVLYEGFGPGKVAFMVEGVTDNKNRTNNEIRNIFDKSGGHMGGVGSVAYMFDRKGEIKVDAKEGVDHDDQLLELIDLGIEDVEDFDDQGKKKLLIYVEVGELSSISKKIAEAGYIVESSEIIYKPNLHTEIKDKETADKVFAFIERIEDNDDIQKVFANFDISENIISEIQGS